MHCSSSIEDLKTLLNHTICDKSVDIEVIVKRLGINISKINDHCISPIDDGMNYTPMQFGSKHGLVGLVKLLLEANVDPNLVDEVVDVTAKKSYIISLHKKRTDRSNKVDSTQEKVSTTDRKNCKTFPLFLAAENGRHEILKLFKYHNFRSQNILKSKILTKDGEIGEEFEKFVSYTNNGTKVNFKVVDKNTGRNVLHTVLQQPLLKDELKTGRDVECMKNKTNIIGQNIHNKLDRKAYRLQLYASGYKNCINVLLDTDSLRSQGGTPALGKRSQDSRPDKDAG